MNRCVSVLRCAAFACAVLSLAACATAGRMQGDVRPFAEPAAYAATYRELVGA